MCELCVTDAVMFAAACVEQRVWHIAWAMLKKLWERGRAVLPFVT